MPKTIKGYFEPSSTSVHSNIDNLILDAELSRFEQTGSMRADTRPQYIGGVDPVVENIALSPILTLKSLGSVGKKLLERTGLKNPVTHYTTSSGATGILKSGTIRGRDQAFPGKPFKRDTRKEIAKRPLLTKFPIAPGSPAVSVTRDPMFLSRPHSHVGSDIGFIMDRGQLTKQGMKIQPFAERGFQKTYQTLRELNPKFEFEERIRGYVPIENVKVIDLARLSPEQSNIDVERFKTLLELAKSKKPIIKSFEAKEGLQKTLNMLKNIPNLRLPKGKPFTKYFQEQGIDIPDYMQATKDLLNTPTYRFNPFLKKA
tara:strand:+ start:284 stop:1228 length:945 start_codon:yes stop_codon:yes gene_type:complete